jgi:hypothetical protein
MNIFQRIAKILEIDVVQLFKAKNTEQDIYTINEPLLQKYLLLTKERNKL